MFRFLVVALVVFLAASPLGAQGHKSALSPEAEAALGVEVKKIVAWGKDPELIKAVLAQNARKITLAQIQEIDNAWVAGGEEGRARELLGNACALRLKALVAKHAAYGESFVMDNQGANVCMTGRTSDFWQGDEAKWQKSFNAGNGQVFVDKPHYDASAKAILVQVSFPVVDGALTVGAITVGIDPSKLVALK
jgi:hypothetical protein